MILHIHKPLQVYKDLKCRIDMYINTYVLDIYRQIQIHIRMYVHIRRHLRIQMFVSIYVHVHVES